MQFNIYGYILLATVVFEVFCGKYRKYVKKTHRAV